MEWEGTISLVPQLCTGQLPRALAHRLASCELGVFLPQNILPDQAHDGTSMRREIYTGGKQGTEVVVYVIEGGGHTWPGGPQYLPAFLIGKASHNLVGTQTIWDFFKRHTR